MFAIFKKRPQSARNHTTPRAKTSPKGLPLFRAHRAHRATRLSFSQGFTLVELLAVLVVMSLMALVALPAADGYSQSIELRKLDNSAREIYMAAQNRASRLASNGMLAGYLNTAPALEINETTKLKYITNVGHPDPGATDGLGELLPFRSIDPTLWKGVFYIFYAPDNNNVIDVFYSTKQPPVSELKTLYNTKDFAERRKILVGYYGTWTTSGNGSLATGATQISLPTPVSAVHNDQTLKLVVTLLEPKALFDEEIMADIEVKVNGKQLPDRLGLNGAAGIATAPPEEKTSLEPNQDNRVTLTYDISEFPFTINGELNVEARAIAKVKSSGDIIGTSGSATSKYTGNGMFANVIGETAYISNARHLRNLAKVAPTSVGPDGKAYEQAVLEAAADAAADAATAPEGVTIPVPQMIRRVIQTCDIDLGGPDGAVNEFEPLPNSNILSYDGGGYSIYNLNINGATTPASSDATATSFTAAAPNSSWGLFRTISGPTQEGVAASVVRNVKIVSPNVRSNAESVKVGIVAGSTVGNVTFENVRITNGAVSTAAAAGNPSTGGVVGSTGGAGNTNPDGTPIEAASRGKTSFTNVSVMNTSVNAKAENAFGNVGGIIGEAAGETKFENTRVCWDIIPDVTKAEGSAAQVLNTAANHFWDNFLTGTNEKKDEGSFFYQINGQNAGGLVGALTTSGVSSSFTKSFAATTIKSFTNNAATGGLVGRCEQTANFTSSYSDCYLAGSNYVGGFIGCAETSATVNHSYVAGYIDISKSARGLSTSASSPELFDEKGALTNTGTGSGVDVVDKRVAFCGKVTPQVVKSYSAMGFTLDGINALHVQPDAKSAGAYYLSSAKSAHASISDGNARTSSELASAGMVNDLGGGSYFELIGEPGGTEASRAKYAGENKTYYLGVKVPGNLKDVPSDVKDGLDHPFAKKYMYPKIVGLPHYGGWWLGKGISFNITNFTLVQTGENLYLNSIPLSLSPGTDSSGQWSCTKIDVTEQVAKSNPALVNPEGSAAPIKQEITGEIANSISENVGKAGSDFLVVVAPAGTPAGTYSLTVTYTVGSEVYRLPIKVVI